MSMWRTVVVAIIAVGLTAAAGGQSKFTLKVHTGKGQIGYDVNSTMIIGDRDIVLIDPQFSLSERTSSPPRYSKPASTSPPSTRPTPIQTIFSGWR